VNVRKTIKGLFLCEEGRELGFQEFYELTRWILPSYNFLAFCDSNEALEHLLTGEAWYLIILSICDKLSVNRFLSEFSVKSVEAKRYDDILVRHGDNNHSLEVREKEEPIKSWIVLDLIRGVVRFVQQNLLSSFLLKGQSSQIKQAYTIKRLEIQIFGSNNLEVVWLKIVALVLNFTCPRDKIQYHDLS